MHSILSLKLGVTTIGEVRACARRFGKVEDDPEASSHGSAPQKPYRPHNQAGVAKAYSGSGGLLSQLFVRIEVGTGKLRGGSIEKHYGGGEF
jgi:hypothetical protein